MKQQQQRQRKWISRGRLVIASAFFLVCCCVFLNFGWGLFHIQAAPLVLRSVTLGGWVACLGLFLLFCLTLLGGRIYCGLLCPLGVLQELLSILRGRRPMKFIHDAPILRMALLGIVWGLLLGGSALGLFFLEPYSMWGRILRASSYLGLFSLGILALFVVWQQRIFCTHLCPVGMLMGLLAKRGLFRLAITSGCVRCGQCEKQCPSGCIDAQSQSLDNARCVRCLACVSTCPAGSIRWVRSSNTTQTQPTDASRRAFLVQSGVLLAGLGVGWVLARQGLSRSMFESKKAPSEGHFLPPGAGNWDRFAARCTGCQRCVQACPSRIIVPGPGGVGPVRLDLACGFCDPTCHRCGTVCPTGAIPSLKPSEKQRLQIALASLQPQQCQVFQTDEPCGRCAQVCPTQAIILRANGAPRPVKTDFCIGCGACQHVCPTRAIQLHPVKQQTLQKEMIK